MRVGRRRGRRKGSLKRCWHCSVIMRRVYVRVSDRGKRTFLAVGWICPRCEASLWEFERLNHLAISEKRKPKERCSCGAPMLRIYIRPQKSQKLKSIGWICLRNHTLTLDEASLKALNAEQ